MGTSSGNNNGVTKAGTESYLTRLEDNSCEDTKEASKSHLTKLEIGTSCGDAKETIESHLTRLGMETKEEWETYLTKLGMDIWTGDTKEASESNGNTREATESNGTKNMESEKMKDWSPVMDGIVAAKSPQDTSEATLQAIDAHTANVLYGPRKTSRLPVFRELCSD